jgi:uncharacterized protein (TIGR02246 family)
LTDAVATLFHAVLAAWNDRDAAAYAALFDADGRVVGFDGSEMNGRTEIERELTRIFADHSTAEYVAKVRGVRLVGERVALLSAVAGMVPRGRSELNPDVNAVQTLVAAETGGEWRVVLFQNTPAQYHGRPEAAEALTAELRALL